MEHTATYSPEDNKLRIYPAQRLDDELGDEYASFKSAGYKWASKQECFVCPRWTPQAEDWALRLCGEIGDEDYSPEERSADRAERFEGYRDKRWGEASDRADTFQAGPQVFGHQNLRRAERQAERHDRHRLHAVSQWSKAEYWQTRTRGVIAHALHRSSAPVRRSRLLRLEAEQRKHEASREEYAKRYAGWQKVLTLEGVDTLIATTESKCENTSNGCILTPSTIKQDTSPAGRLAYALVNGHCWGDYKHPRRDGRWSLFSLLTDAQDPITPREAATMWLDGRTEPSNPDSWSARWSAHYDLRIGYERAMLENEGGMAAEADIEPGGWICTSNRTGSVFTDVSSGWKQIQSVNKSPATGRVVSVKVWGTTHSAIAENHGKPVLVSVNIERLGDGHYRAPTDEELAKFTADTKARKAEVKASKPAAPSLINPTEDDAERLQGILNKIGKAKHEAKRQKWETGSGYDYKPTPVLRMTQAKYSEVSRGSYSHYETRTLHNAGGIIARRSSNMYSSEGSAYDKALGGAVCKVRIRSSEGWNNPPHIVVITDKPQKPLPLDWEKVLDQAAEAA